MFTTIERVRELTGKDVSQETIIMAQNIIEAYTGKDEIEVTAANDRALLEKAVSYQSAYMHDDEAKVFEQIGANQIMQFGQMISFDPKSASPWVAPLAAMACKRLSWKGVRSIKTGPLFPSHVGEREGWRYE